MTSAVHTPVLSQPAPSRRPLVAATSSVALLAAGFALGAGELTLEDVVDGIGLMAFPVVGALLLSRGGPRTVGWLMCAVGLVSGAGFLVGGYAGHPWPGHSVAQVLGEMGFVATIMLVLVFLLLHFPDGRLPSARWRPVLRIAQATLAVTMLSMLLAPGPVDEDAPDGPANPLGIAGAEPVLDVVEPVSLLLFAGLALVALGSVFWRLRPASPSDRRSIAILGVGSAVMVTLFLLDSTLQSIGGEVYGVVAAVIATAAIPLAVAAALLRRR